MRRHLLLSLIAVVVIASAAALAQVSRAERSQAPAAVRSPNTSRRLCTRSASRATDQARRLRSR